MAVRTTAGCNCTTDKIGLYLPKQCQPADKQLRSKLHLLPVATYTTSVTVWTRYCRRFQALSMCLLLSISFCTHLCPNRHDQLCKNAFLLLSGQPSCSHCSHFSVEPPCPWLMLLSKQCALQISGLLGTPHPHLLHSFPGLVSWIPLLLLMLWRILVIWYPLAAHLYWYELVWIFFILWESNQFESLNFTAWFKERNCLLSPLN